MTKSTLRMGWSRRSSRPCRGCVGSSSSPAIPASRTRAEAVDIKQIARELGVRYVLEGSVRKAGNRVRISGQLIDAATGSHLWADRFDGALDDIFDLQDQVTSSVVGAIAPKVEQAEIERAKRKPTESLDAYDHFLHGMANLYRSTREANIEAVASFSRATDLDPTFASAYGMAARCYDQRKLNGWVTDSGKESAEVARLARKVTEHGWEDAVALCSAGIAVAYVVNDLDHGAALIDRALLLNPNLAAAWSLSGWIKVCLCEPDAAIERVTRAMRLSPHDPFSFDMQTTMAFAHFTAGRYTEALSWAEAAVRRQPNFSPALRILAASNAMLGRKDQARNAASRALDLNPEFRISDVRIHPDATTGGFGRYQEGLRRRGCRNDAGCPPFLRSSVSSTSHCPLRPNNSSSRL